MARNTQVAADHNAPPITQILARFVAEHPSRGWSDAVDHEAHRTFLNWLGCAVGAARHEAADAALAAVNMLQPAPQATVLGRGERVDMASAALVNGITSHTFDFDDTHLKTIIHPAGPVASALLALAEHQGASGRALVDALVIGIDVACRLGNTVYPEHYDRGWHITGTKRHPQAKDVPTLEESGFKGFDAMQWYGVVGPAGMPEPIVRQLNETLATVLKAPDLSEKLSVEAVEPMPMSPQQFADFIRADIARWTQLARERHIELDN